MRVTKWGNNSAVRLPVGVVEALLNRLQTFRSRLPADFKFDRDEANAR